MHVVNHNCVEDLKSLAGRTDKPWIKVRLIAISMAMESHTSPEIATKLGCHRVSIVNWVSAYNREGLDSLKKCKWPGWPRKLTHVELLKIKTRLHQELDLLRTPKSALIDGMTQILNDEYQVVYSRSRMYDLVDKITNLE